MTTGLDRERVVAARALIVAFCTLPGNELGGVLHGVVEDGNWEAGSVEWSLAEAAKERDEPAVALAEMLLALPDDERRLAVAQYLDPELVALIGVRTQR